MVWLKPADQCHCDICPGRIKPPNGQYGGMICTCSCHRLKEWDKILIPRIENIEDKDDTFDS